MELIQEGTYNAKILDYGIKSTKAGDPQATVKFSVKAGEKDYHLYWQGGFSEKAMKHTLKALVTLGLSKGVEEMADGMASGALDTSKEYSVQVEHNEYQGKVTARIAWINTPHKFANLMNKNDVKAKLGMLNLKGELAAIRKELGVEAPKPAVAPSVASNNAPDFDDDLTF